MCVTRRFALQGVRGRQPKALQIRSCPSSLSLLPRSLTRSLAIPALVRVPALTPRGSRPQRKRIGRSPLAHRRRSLVRYRSPHVRFPPVSVPRTFSLHRRRRPTTTTSRRCRLYHYHRRRSRCPSRRSRFGNSPRRSEVGRTRDAVRVPRTRRQEIGLGQGRLVQRVRQEVEVWEAKGERNQGREGGTGPLGWRRRHGVVDPRLGGHHGAGLDIRSFSSSFFFLVLFIFAAATAS